MSFFPVHVPRRRGSIVPPPYQSFVFDGVDDVLQLTWTSTASDSERRVFTSSFWAKVDTFTSNEAMGYSSFFNTLFHTCTFTTITNVGSEAAVQGLAFPSTLVYGESPSTEDSYADEWVHVVAAHDSTQANGADRIKIYLNGQYLPHEFRTPIAQNGDFNGMFTDTAALFVGALFSQPMKGKIAILEFVTGAALPPTAFGEQVGSTWMGKKYAGSYGSFGARWDGTDGFNDVSGNGFDLDDQGSGVALDPVDLPPLLS